MPGQNSTYTRVQTSEATSHFYIIWTQYALIEPDQLDPSLGTPLQFKSMIDEVHERGIRILTDVVTHGVSKAIRTGFAEVATEWWTTIGKVATPI